MHTFMEEYQRWLDSPALSEQEWAELNAISGDEKEIRERFYAPLEFGTAGLRGTMKTGLHNMNIHIIRHATQAFADVICAEGETAKKKGIVIAHDCRLNGRQFAEEAAAVMAANGIYVRIFDALRPTPELSFAVRYYGATAGLNVTASHNPKEYNGYKVYWSDGAQLPPQHADAIAKRMAETDLFTCLRTGDRVTLRGKCAQPERATNPGQFDMRRYYHARNIYFTLTDVKIEDAARAKPGIETPMNLLRDALCELKYRMQLGLSEVFGREDASCLAAMLLGDRSGLDEKRRQIFQDGGIAYLLTVSALHVTLTGRTVYRLLRHFRRSFVCSALVSMGTVLTYVILTGGSISSQRARWA